MQQSSSKPSVTVGLLQLLPYSNLLMLKLEPPSGGLSSEFYLDQLTPELILSTQEAEEPIFIHRTP